MTRKNDSYPLQPPRERGTGRAIALAVIMHVLLGLFLYHGIHWQNSTPAGEEAELWTEVPDLSTPKPLPPPAPVAPAPPPPQTEDADIALQQQKRKQQEAQREAQLAEQQRLKAQQEADAKRQQQLAAQQAAQLAAQQKTDKLKQQQQQQAAADKQKQQQQQQQDALKKQQQEEDQQKQAKLDAQKKADADKAAKAKAQADALAKKLDAERRARIAQMQGSMGGGEGTSGNGLAKSGTGSGSGGNATSAEYADKVQRRVRPNIIWSGETAGLVTVVAVHVSPTGTLLSAQIQRGSGNSQWDDAALRAVQRSDPMPLDTNGKAPPSYFLITLRPAG